eukprot:XP_010654948.1 PREDICTED: uncharacterized protein LOC100853605 [Vitis vinifera]
MADALVSIVLEWLALVIQRQIQQELRLLVGAENDVQKLTNTLRNIRAVLVDAEKRQVKDEAGVDNALTHKKKVCSCIPFPCFPIRRIHLCHDIALKIGEINRRLDVIAQEKVFPKNHVIKRDNLIKLWMAQSYLSSKSKEMETIGHSTLIRVLPKGIGRLSSLRTLAEIAVVGDDDDDNSLKVGDLPNLNNLCGHLAISGLGNVRDARAAEKAELKKKKHLHI